MSVHLFGIRHHGVGSSRSLIAALEQLQPDCVLIEGPPEADTLIPFLADPAMQTPVALLIYDSQRPMHAAWYPFAVYSPEWQAIQYAARHAVDVKFMDLPLKHLLALEPLKVVESEGEAAANPVNDVEKMEKQAPQQPLIQYDPLQKLAQLAGESDGERWWNRIIEELQNPTDIFDLIHEAMATLRADEVAAHPEYERREQLREARMRKTIRAAEKDHKTVAVVCGAWHVPALHDRANSKADNEALKGLPSVKTEATVAPWTYSRIARDSGYGAGVVSPGWYHHLWHSAPEEVSVRWLSTVAALLRDEGMLASTAQVIDAVRLSDMLTTLRQRSVTGLDELNEATLAVLTAGRSEPLALIHRKLIVGERMGSVPSDTPSVPLQRDVEAQQKRLRLKISADKVTLDLDLRQANDLERSVFFRRLRLLGIPWAVPSKGDVRGKGTFHEFWELNWSPEMQIRILEQSVWGNSVAESTTQFVNDVAANTKQLSEITRLVEDTMLAELPIVLANVLRRLNDLASLSHDIHDLLAAIPSLVETVRYGNVRKTDVSIVKPVLESVVVRACIGLYAACVNIDDDAASPLNKHLPAVNSALNVLAVPHLSERWHETLHKLSESDVVHPLLAGTATRLLFRAEKIADVEVARLMHYMFSKAQEPKRAALWLEGFLTGMEQVLLRDSQLFTLIDHWVIKLEGEQFDQLLPLLRRTFATYSAPSRRNLGERIKRGERVVKVDEINQTRAERVVPLMSRILGLNQ